MRFLISTSYGIWCRLFATNHTCQLSTLYVRGTSQSTTNSLRNVNNSSVFIASSVAKHFSVTIKAYELCGGLVIFCSSYEVPALLNIKKINYDTSL
jgi:hypothetical protein